MKTYYGTFIPGVAEHKVVVRDDRSGSTEPLAHVVKHSPGGFSWGYGGSGPSELARCILLDYLGDAVHCPTCKQTGRVPSPESGRDLWCSTCMGECYLLPPRTYQQFKVDFVAQWPMDKNWAITSREIAEWLNMKGEFYREPVASR